MLVRVCSYVHVCRNACMCGCVDVWMLGCMYALMHVCRDYEPVSSLNVTLNVLIIGCPDP